MSQRQTQGKPAQGQRTNASGRVGGRNRAAERARDIENITAFTGTTVGSQTTAQAQTTAGRRAQSRAAAAQAQARAVQQRRRLLLVGGGSAVLVVAIVAVVLLLTHPWQSNGMTDPNALNPAPNMLAKGTTAPDFTLSTVNGQQHTLSSLRGHPVILEFFAVWCPYCQAMAPLINNVEKQYANKGVQTLSVLASPFGRNYDISYHQDTSLATKDDMNWFASNFNVKHPLLVDPSFSVTNQYGAGSYPTVYVLDRNGVIRYSSQGAFAQKALADAVAKAS